MLPLTLPRVHPAGLPDASGASGFTYLLTPGSVDGSSSSFRPDPSSGHSCGSTQWCVLAHNPGSGFRHYDHMLWGFLSVFQVGRRMGHGAWGGVRGM